MMRPAGREADSLHVSGWSIPGVGSECRGPKGERGCAAELAVACAVGSVPMASFFSGDLEGCPVGIPVQLLSCGGSEGCHKRLGVETLGAELTTAVWCSLGASWPDSRAQLREQCWYGGGSLVRPRC
jgi:hypothetical protein